MNLVAEGINVCKKSCKNLQKFCERKRCKNTGLFHDFFSQPINNSSRCYWKRRFTMAAVFRRISFVTFGLLQFRNNESQKEWIWEFLLSSEFVFHKNVVASCDKHETLKNFIRDRFLTLSSEKKKLTMFRHRLMFLVKVFAPCQRDRAKIIHFSSSFQGYVSS